jgi:hypothetical protein
MEKTIEKIPQDKLESILNFQKEANQIIVELGQIHLQSRDLELNIKKLNEIKTGLEDKFDKVSLNMDNLLGDLQKNYPNGEIDLIEGTITYQK